MSSVNYRIFFNSGMGNVIHYSTGDNINFLSIENSDDSYYQNGMLSLFDVPSSSTIGDTVMIFISNVLQFNGYIARREQSIEKGKRIDTYQLIGKTYDLWRYVTDHNAIYSGTTAYIASSLISTYASDIFNGGVDPTQGFFLVDNIDLTNITVGDAIVALTNIDGYSFYVDNYDNLHYYVPESSAYSFTIEESDIIGMTPIEQADEDIVNDCLVIGGTGYSKITNISPTHPSSAIFPNNVLVAQRFEAEDSTLSAVKLYLDRTRDPNQPTTLNFEIWDNTSKIMFEDDFDDYTYLINSGDDYYNLNIENSLLLITGNTACGISGGSSGPDTANHPYYAGYGQEFICNTSGYLRMVLCRGGDHHYTHDWYYELRKDSRTGDLVWTSDPFPIVGGWATPVYINDDYVHMISGQKYALMVVDTETPDWTQVRGRWTDATSYGGCDYLYLNQSYVWSTRSNVVARYFDIDIEGDIKTSGQILSNSYTVDTQYMKLDMDGVVSSSRIYISGTNDGGTTWKELPNNQWVDFGSESSVGIMVKYKFSSNGCYTPRIDMSTLTVADSTGAFDEVIFDESFDDESYLSSQSNNDMAPVYDGNLQLSGANVTGYQYKYPDSINADSHWTWPGRIILPDAGAAVDFNQTSYRTYTDEFTFTTPQHIDAIYILACGQSWYTEYLKKVWISGTNTSEGWSLVFDGSTMFHRYLPYYENFGPHTFDGGYKYKDIKRLKVQWLHTCTYNCQVTYYDLKVRIVPNYELTGNIKTEKVDTNLSMSYLDLNLSNVAYPDSITYSGSCDNGVSWTKLTPNGTTQIGVPGNEIVLWYCMKPSGTGYEKSGATLLPDTPKIGDSELIAWLVKGGGVPKSGSKVEWSDDISWSAGDVPYPPSTSSWKPYSYPKLSPENFKDNSFWIVMYNNSGSSKYWEYYYDSKSNYDGKIAYSWDYGVNWSSNSIDPDQVPDGNITLRLGWTEGDITARAINQDSIDLFGRHFKKITDSTINTLEFAQIRADAEVSGMLVAPKKGMITINGRTDLSVESRFSSNLTNFGIDDIWDIVSYTQSIDDRGFTSTINYNVHSYDLAKRINDLEREVY